MPEKQATLYTFGYLSSKAERIIKELITVKTPLIDVRMSPDSKNWRYTQDAMRNRSGIIYYHVGELGNELYKEALTGQFTEPHVRLHQPQEGLAKLKEILDTHGRAAIFCACSSHARCHREQIARLAQEQLHVKVIHL